MSAAQEPVTLRPGVLVHPATDRQLAAAQWLLSAHPAPEQARMEWSGEGGVALLPLGTLYSAVRIPERMVHAAAGSSEPTAVNEYLAQALLGGPVICDPSGRRYYALVPASTATRWRHGDAVCLGRGTFLGVPRLDVVELDPRAWASYWAVPMPSAAMLCWPDAVAQLVITAAFLTASAEEEPGE
ncbi:hypothetical protein [Streptomyces phaeochromogenes]